MTHGLGFITAFLVVGGSICSGLLVSGSICSSLFVGRVCWQWLVHGSAPWWSGGDWLPLAFVVLCLVLRSDAERERLQDGM